MAADREVTVPNPPWGKARWAAAAVAVVAGIASLFPASSGSSGAAVPAALVGNWGKQMSMATWKKHGITYEAAGHWGIRIGAGGVTALVQPPATPTSAPLTTMHTAF